MVSIEQSDDALLRRFGYNQQFARTLKRFGSFAVAFSFISITTGIFTTFAFLLANSGPRGIWTWPIVIVGQTLVAMVYAALAAKIPLSVELTGPEGVGAVTARALLLATGCRERPRSARLVPGDRPLGVLTTGALQQLVHLHHQPVGRRAVVVGAEHVSYSALLTLARAGAATVALVTEEPRHQTFAAFHAAARLRWRVPLLRWVAPGAVVPGAGPPPCGWFTLRATEFLDHARLEARQGQHLLWSKRHRHLVPTRAIHARAPWIDQVEPTSGPVTFSVAR